MSDNAAKSTWWRLSENPPEVWEIRADSRTQPSSRSCWSRPDHPTLQPPGPKVFGLLAADVGGLIGQIRHNLTSACDAGV